jgi:hypothetical protein
LPQIPLKNRACSSPSKLGVTDPLHFSSLAKFETKI